MKKEEEHETHQEFGARAQADRKNKKRELHFSQQGAQQEFGPCWDCGLFGHPRDSCTLTKEEIALKRERDEKFYKELLEKRKNSQNSRSSSSSSQEARGPWSNRGLR
mmetsp:Transcript_34399/g.68007  ORF Transcript_34399/g.68007 Transcript_34399/m.68007 type:complete len:107 (-) Transcript_34399:307-627(-)